MTGEAGGNKGSKGAVFIRRLLSTLLLWGLVTGVFVSGQAWAFLALIGALTVVATSEYFRMLAAGGVKCFPRFAVLLAVLYSLGLYAILLNCGKTDVAALEAVAVFVMVAGAFALQFRYPVRGIESLLSVGATVLGFAYIALFFNFAARLVMAVPGEGQVPGAWVLLWLVAVTKFTDMGAYAVGSMIGRHKMIPHISPGKTWEGFGGAILFAQLAGCGLFALMPVHLAALGSWSHVVVLSLILALFAVIGDLAESVLKRSVNAKDSGRFLPGIGGALDLIDSLCFTAPVLYFYLKWVVKSAA